MSPNTLNVEPKTSEKKLETVQEQWPAVQRAVAPLRRERRLNGWTDTIVGIFESPEQKDSP